MRVLVVNAGSSSVKLRVVEDSDEVTASADLGPPDEGLPAKLDEFLRSAGNLDVAGHRVVHGGDTFREPTVVDESARRRLDLLNNLAPLHNPPALAAIDALAQRRPALANVACFDTSFHLDMPAAASRYALPSPWVDRWKIRRYGFHGLSCEWATERASQSLGHPARPHRLVICHLGSGASVTAVLGGRSVDTTMGFTPAEGLVMSTRSGDVDPGALVWLMQQGLTLDDLARGLEHEAGLLGLAGGTTGDMSVLLRRRDLGDATAASAIDVYLHRLRAKIAAMGASLGGIDSLVFTGGIGEHLAPIRSEACSSLRWLGVGIDENANSADSDDDRNVTAAGCSARTLVVHAREDLIIARACRRLSRREA